MSASRSESAYLDAPLFAIHRPRIWPKRIVCLTAETTELAFALGVGDRVVGVSGYSIRPAEARLKPRVAAFTTLRLERLRELEPDLVLGFSDLQKDIARKLVEEGYHVFITNQRSLEETGDVIMATGRLLGREERAVELYEQFFFEFDRLAEELGRLRNETRSKRPKVYFEEWDSPMISGIRWVSEIIRKLGGEDAFVGLSSGVRAAQRTVRSEDVIAANPDIILASWCGKKVALEKIAARPGWDAIEAVRHKRIFEIKSPDILAPGLSLLHGAAQMAEIFRDYYVAP